MAEQCVTVSNVVAPGVIDIAPETLRLAITSYWAPGISSQIINPAFSLTTKTLLDDAILIKNVPFASSFIDIVPDERMQERACYDRMKE